jgi:hypothetical protein
VKGQSFEDSAKFIVSFINTVAIVIKLSIGIPLDL